MLLAKRIIKGDIKSFLRRILFMIPLIIIMFFSAALAISPAAVGGIGSFWIGLGGFIIFCICINAYAKNKYEDEIKLSLAIFAWMDVETFNIVKEERSLFNDIQVKEEVQKMMGDPQGRKDLIQYILKAHNNVLAEIASKFEGYIER